MISAAQAEHYHWGEQCEGWHLVRAAGLSVIQERIPPGSAEVRHRHAHARQFFFVLSGVATFELEGMVSQLGVREGIEVPPAAAHQIWNAADVPLDFLVISQPPAQGDRTLA